MKATTPMLSCLLALGCAAPTQAPTGDATPAASAGAEGTPREAPTGADSPPEASDPGPAERANHGLDPVAVVGASDRSDADRALDAGRKPAETLAFFGVRPGMRVAEIAAGTGYTSELLAHAVGAEGQVHAVNSPWVLERFAEQPWSARLAKPVMQNTVRLDREFDDPFPAELGDLDLIVSVLFYHDTVWMKSDRAAMNAAVFRALKPGGHYVVIDHSGRKGSGTGEVQTLHRIEESVVQREVEAAGFKLEASGDFLRNPDDLRDWNASPMQAGERRGQSDRFALKFVKP